MTFLNPFVLIGMLGISLPILAHLINRQQVQRTDWAAMQFLTRNVRVRSRQIRLRDILLLILRCLALSLLILALARPATVDSESWLPGEPNAGVVIAIDGSFSMMHRDGESSRFDQALDRVRTITKRIPQGDPVSVVLLGGNHQSMLQNVAYNEDRIADLIETAAPTQQTLDLDNVPRQLDQLVQDMDALHKEVYLITDAQTESWRNPAPATIASLQQLEDKASVFVVPVTTQSDNLAVTSLDLISGSLRKGAVARYRATVHNFGQNPVSNIEVRCRLEGVQIDSKPISAILPGESESVSLFVPFYDAGISHITAEISDQSLTVDNVRRTVAVVREKLSVLCFDGSGGDACRLTMAGLLARDDGSEEAGYVVRTAQWPSLPPEGFDGFDLVIMTDIPEITPQQAEDLARFIRRGNGLIWFPGSNTKINEWNELSAQQNLLPAQLGTLVDARDALGNGKPLASQIPDHTITRPLKSLPQDLISETRYLRQLRVTPTNTSFPVLNLAGTGSPILIERSLGRGHVVMFTTSANTAWNNMALTPVFPMLMQQIVTYLSGREFEQARVVGDSLTLTYVEQPDSSDAVFETPSGETITVPVRKRADQYVALLENSEQSGFYTARAGVQDEGTSIAVNVDTTESNIQSIATERLKERLEGSGIEVIENSDELIAGINRIRTGRTSWRYLMLFALGFLLLENLFADRLGKRKGSQATTQSSGEAA